VLRIIRIDTPVKVVDRFVDRIFFLRQDAATREETRRSERQYPSDAN
jgi:hypothetical protein